MKKILIPIDFSTSSKHASKLASKIARGSNSEVHILHMIELPKGVLDITSKGVFSIPENMLYIKKTKEAMQKFEDTYFSKNDDVIQSILFESPSEGILKYNKKINADLIVMGSKGHSAIEELLIGSNTEKTIRTSKTPVLVVKKDEENFKQRNLVFASDFKESETKNEPLKKLIDFSERFKSTFHLLKINTPSQFENTQVSKQKMEKFAEKYNLTKYTINTQNDSSIEEGIVNFSNEVYADIIALESQGRSYLSHFLNRSVTKHVSNSALQPVIIFKT